MSHCRARDADAHPHSKLWGCAATQVIQTPSRRHLGYPRARWTVSLIAPLHAVQPFRWSCPPGAHGSASEKVSGYEDSQARLDLRLRPAPVCCPFCIFHFALVLSPGLPEPLLALGRGPARAPNPSRRAKQRHGSPCARGRLAKLGSPLFSPLIPSLRRPALRAARSRQPPQPDETASPVRAHPRDTAEGREASPDQDQHYGRDASHVARPGGCRPCLPLAVSPASFAPLRWQTVRTH